MAHTLSDSCSGSLHARDAKGLHGQVEPNSDLISVGAFPLADMSLALHLSLASGSICSSRVSDYAELE